MSILMDVCPSMIFSKDERSMTKLRNVKRYVGISKKIDRFNKQSSIGIREIDVSVILELKKSSNGQNEHCGGERKRM